MTWALLMPDASRPGGFYVSSLSEQPRPVASPAHWVDVGEAAVRRLDDYDPESGSFYRRRDESGEQVKTPGPVATIQRRPEKVREYRRPAKAPRAPRHDLARYEVRGGKLYDTKEARELSQEEAHELDPKSFPRGGEA